MMPLLKGIHDGQKFFVINLIVNIDKKILTRMETNCMKKISSSGCANTTLNAKLVVHFQNKRVGKVCVNKKMWQL
jgi:hypothetical protein